jgi:hypothetical protein
MKDRRKEQAARLKSQGVVNREIAERIGVNERTVERWTNLSEFRACVRSFAREEPLVAKSGKPIQVGSDLTDIEDDLDELPVLELADRVLRKIIRDGSDLSKLKAIQILIDNEIPNRDGTGTEAEPDSLPTAIMAMIEAEGAKLAASQSLNS